MPRTTNAKEKRSANGAAADTGRRSGAETNRKTAALPYDPKDFLDFFFARRMRENTIAEHKRFAEEIFEELTWASRANSIAMLLEPAEYEALVAKIEAVLPLNPGDPHPARFAAYNIPAHPLGAALSALAYGDERLQHPKVAEVCAGALRAVVAALRAVDVPAKEVHEWYDAAAPLSRGNCEETRRPIAELVKRLGAKQKRDLLRLLLAATIEADLELCRPASRSSDENPFAGFPRGFEMIIHPSEAGVLRDVALGLKIECLYDFYNDVYKLARDRILEAESAARGAARNEIPHDELGISEEAGRIFEDLMKPYENMTALGSSFIIFLLSAETNERERMMLLLYPLVLAEAVLSEKECEELLAGGDVGLDRPEFATMIFEFLRLKMREAEHGENPTKHPAFEGLEPQYESGLPERTALALARALMQGIDPEKAKELRAMRSAIELLPGATSLTHDQLQAALGFKDEDAAAFERVFCADSLLELMHDELPGERLPERALDPENPLLTFAIAAAPGDPYGLADRPEVKAALEGQTAAANPEPTKH